MTAALAVKPRFPLADPDRLAVLPVLAMRSRTGQLKAAEYASLYFLYWQIALHGDQFASRKQRTDSRPNSRQCLNDLQAATGAELRAKLIDYFERYQFRGVISNVSVALCAWLRDEWPLQLREDVPSALDVLRAQATGARPVTVIADYPRLLEPVLTKANGFDFFVHDLEHAYKFFHSAMLCESQRQFFAKLLAAVDAFSMYFEESIFRQKFEYLMSDMNTHPEHGRAYLRAILIEFYLRRENKAPRDALSPTAKDAIEGLLHAVA